MCKANLCLPAKYSVDVAREPVYSQKSKLSCKYFSTTDNRAPHTVGKKSPATSWVQHLQRLVHGIHSSDAHIVQMQSHSCPAGTSVLLSLVLAVFCYRRNYLRFLNFSIWPEALWKAPVFRSGIHTESPVTSNNAGLCLTCSCKKA